VQATYVLSCDDVVVRTLQRALRGGSKKGEERKKKKGKKKQRKKEKLLIFPAPSVYNANGIYGNAVFLYQG
jgi:hypothetical protein